MLKEIASSQDMLRTREPLAQEVILSIETTQQTKNHFLVTEILGNPPTVLYSDSDKIKYEQTVTPQFYVQFENWRLKQAHGLFRGKTRGLNAGQLAHTPKGEIIFIAKSPVNNPDKIEALDLIAGASQQIGSINLLQTAAREGTGEELVEIDPAGNIIVPKGLRDYTIESLRKNVQRFCSNKHIELSEPFLSTFTSLINNKTDNNSTEIHYNIHPSLFETFKKLPTAEVNIEGNDKDVHTSQGYCIIHTSGGDIMYPRIVENIDRIIDLEISRNPDGTNTALNRKFVLATPEEAFTLWQGKEVEITMIHMGKQWKTNLLTTFKPLAHEMIRILAEK
jgi:hypothetical protein